MSASAAASAASRLELGVGRPVAGCVGFGVAHGGGLEVVRSGLAGAGQLMTDESFSVAMRLPLQAR